jgi:hypothetical protein
MGGIKDKNKPEDILGLFAGGARSTFCRQASGAFRHVLPEEAQVHPKEEEITK